MRNKRSKKKSYFKDKKLIKFLLFIISFFAVGNLWIWIKRRGERLDDEIIERYRKKNAPPSNKIVYLTRFPTEWECDYCEKVIKYEGDTKLPYFPEVRPTLVALTEEHLKECEKAQYFFRGVDSKKDNNNNDDEKTLKRKGYSGRFFIERIKTWGLLNRINLPDLNLKERVGIMKELSVLMRERENSDDYELISGYCSDILIFLLPRMPPPITSQGLPRFLKKDNTGFFFQDSKKNNNYEKIVASFFIERIIQKVGEWKLNIFSLEINTSYPFSKVEGRSGTLSLYLALLSAYYQKPISQEVAASGFLNIGDCEKFDCCPLRFQEELAKNPRENFSKNKISPVGSLEYKVPAAVKAGAKKLVLSTEQQENYEKVVPQEIREKLKVYYVENVEELEELFWQGEFS